MRVQSDKANIQIDTDSTPPRYTAGEGEIYVIPPEVAAKIYLAALLDRTRQEKVLAMCSKYSFYCGILSRNRLAFPQFPMTSVDDNEVVGFTMRFFGDLPQLEEIGFDLHGGRFKQHSGRSLTDQSAVALVYDLYAALETFRRANVVLGDVHPRNILYDWNSNEPVFVDIDSAQIERFPVTAFLPQYVDPLVAGSDNQAHFSYMSDRFAMAVVAYELLVGRNPFWLRCDPNDGIPGNKRASVSLLGFHTDRSYMDSRHVALVDHQDNRLILERLNTIRNIDRRLYQFMSDVLLGTCRDSLLQRLPRSDARHPANRFTAGGKGLSLSEELDQARRKLEARPPTTTVLDPDRYVELMTAYGLRNETVNSNDPDNFVRFVTTLGFDYVQMKRQGINVV